MKRSEIISKAWPWLAALTIIILVGFIRIRLLQIPLERDEGEFAYMGQLLLKGIAPYSIACNIKLPGIYAIYALIMAILGENIAAIHTGLLIANTTSIILMFLLTRSLFGNVSAIVAAASYALLSVSPSVLGTSAHATQFIVPFVLGGILLLRHAFESGNRTAFFVSGLLFGIAFIIKQHAILFILFAFVYSLGNFRKTSGNWEKPLVSNLLLLAGSAFPFLLVCTLIYYSGNLYKFWFWTFIYARQYASEVSFHSAVLQFASIVQIIAKPWVCLLAIACFGIAALIWNKKLRIHVFFVLAFVLFSFLSVCPGFFFRKHYFVTLLPAISMLAGIGTASAYEWLAERKKNFLKVLPIVIFISLLIPLIYHWNFFFKAGPAEASRSMYWVNPFPESLAIAEFIKNNSDVNDRIIVLGSEPQIYFYANRISATKYIYTYDLVKNHPYTSLMQADIVREIESTPPKYAVLVNIPMSWAIRPGSDSILLDWMKSYFSRHYHKVHEMEIISYDYRHFEEYRHYWIEAANKNQPFMIFKIYVFERNHNG